MPRLFPTPSLKALGMVHSFLSYVADRQTSSSSCSFIENKKFIELRQNHRQTDVDQRLTLATVVGVSEE